MPLLVFIDTNILKFAATELTRFARRRETLKWGPKTMDVIVHDEVVLNPNDNISNPELKAEADLLSEVANYAKVGVIEFVQSVEARYEEWGLPNMDSQTGKFFGAAVGLIEAPFKYGRVMGGLGIDGEAEQYRFLSSIRDARFLAIQRATGAYQGAQPLNRNQLIDAFHIWCAESAGCSHFLTLDFKLLRTLAQSKLEIQVTVLRPSALIAAISDSLPTIER